MKRHVMVAVTMALLWASAAGAQAPSGDPSGLWRTVDDKTGEVRSVVRIFESGGVLYGRVERVIDPKAVGRVCEKCSGDRHNKPLVGLNIIRGLHADGANSWSGGEILDPETGDTYRLSARLEDAGRKLVVRGSILGGLVGRSQTWMREPS